MTTGRINQVTTFQMSAEAAQTTTTFQPKGRISQLGVHQLFLLFKSECSFKVFSSLAAILDTLEPTLKLPCSPIPQILEALLLVTLTATKIMFLRENYHQPAQSS